MRASRATPAGPSSIPGNWCPDPGRSRSSRVSSPSPSRSSWSWWLPGQPDSWPRALRHAAMKIEPFSLERSMTRHETRVRYDLAESGIYPLCVGDLLGWLPAEERDAALEGLLGMRLGYSEACGTLALRTLIAATYAGCERSEER